MKYTSENMIKDLESDCEFYRKQIKLLKIAVAEEDGIIQTNGGKTAMQNPKIKTLNDFTKNYHNSLSQIQKIKGTDGGEKNNEIFNLLQNRPK